MSLAPTTNLGPNNPNASYLENLKQFNIGPGDEDPLLSETHELELNKTNMSPFSSQRIVSVQNKTTTERFNKQLSTVKIKDTQEHGQTGRNFALDLQDTINTFQKIEEESDLDKYDAGTSAVLPSSVDENELSKESLSESSESSSDGDSDYRKDPAWRKLTMKEKDRLRKRIMRSYVKAQAKDEEIQAEKNLKKIKGYEKKIHKELNEQRLTEMVNKRKDKLKDYYNVWMIEKQKEFASLKAEIAQRLKEKDNNDVIIADLKEKWGYQKSKSDEYQDKWKKVTDQNRVLTDVCENQAQEIIYMTNSMKKDKKWLKQLSAQNNELISKVKLLEQNLADSKQQLIDHKILLKANNHTFSRKNSYEMIGLEIDEKANFNSIKFRQLLDDLFKINFEEFGNETSFKWNYSCNVVKNNLVQYFNLLDKNFQKQLNNKTPDSKKHSRKSSSVSINKHPKKEIHQSVSNRIINKLESENRKLKNIDYTEITQAQLFKIPKKQIMKKFEGKYAVLGPSQTKKNSEIITTRHSQSNSASQNLKKATADNSQVGESMDYSQSINIITERQTPKNLSHIPKKRNASRFSTIDQQHREMHNYSSLPRIDVKNQHLQSISVEYPTLRNDFSQRTMITAKKSQKLKRDLDQANKFNIIGGSIRAKSVMRPQEHKKLQAQYQRELRKEMESVRSQMKEQDIKLKREMRPKKEMTINKDIVVPMDETNESQGSLKTGLKQFKNIYQIIEAENK